MSKLMVLGAGIYQVPLIKRAQEMGIEVLVVSYPGPYPGLEIADRSFPIDTTDASAVLEVAEREKIDGITTTGTDVAVRTIGIVCDKLSLHGVSEKCALRLTDKADMKDMFLAGGVPTAIFERVETLDSARDAASLIGLPVMVKACDVSGSRGITKVDIMEDLDSAFNAAMSVTHTSHVIVESWVEGTEIGIDGFVVDGKVALFAPHGKFTLRSGGVTIPAGHAFPLALPSNILTQAREAIERAVQASEMTIGAFNCDVMITPRGEVSVLEMGGRCGATGIPELITLHTGIDYYGEIIKASLGQPVSLVPRKQLTPCMSGLLFSERDGIVESINSNKIMELERQLNATVTIDVMPGDRVHAVHNGTDRFGSIVMPTNSESQLKEALAEIRSCVVLS